MNNRIRELRKQKNLTMKQLGGILGLAESTISQYETGKREPDLKTLLKISEYFGVSVEYLLGTADENGFLTPEGFADPDDYEFITLLGLDDPQKRKNLVPDPIKPDILDEVDIAFYGGYKELSEDDKETIRQMVQLMRERRQNEKPPQD